MPKATIVLCFQHGRTNYDCFVFSAYFYIILAAQQGGIRDNSKVLSGPNTRQRKRKAAESQVEAEAETENSNKKTKIILKTSQTAAESDNEELFNAPKLEEQWIFWKGHTDCVTIALTG